MVVQLNCPECTYSTTEPAELRATWRLNIRGKGFPVNSATSSLQGMCTSNTIRVSLKYMVTS